MLLYDTLAESGKRSKFVKLSWLLRYPNYGSIVNFIVETPTTADQAYECNVKVNLDDGRFCVFKFASKDVLNRFLFAQHKRIFDGIPVVWFGVERTIKA